METERQPQPPQGQVQERQDTNDEEQKEVVEASLVPKLPPQLSAATRAIHADDHLNETLDVAPPMHVSTTFHHRHSKAGSKKTHDGRKNNMDKVGDDDDDDQIEKGQDENDDEDEDEDELVPWDERNVCY